MNVALSRFTVLCTVATLLITVSTVEGYDAASNEAPIIASPTPMPESAWSGTAVYSASPAYGYSPAATRYVRDYGGWSGVVGPSPKIFATVEGIGLRMNGGTRHANSVVIDQDTTQTLLTTHDTQYDMEARYRVTAGARFNNGLLVEGTFFQITEWDATAIALGNNNLTLDGDLGLVGTADFFDVDEFTLRQRATLDNWEINSFWPEGVTDFSWLVGVRYVDLNESYNINAFDLDSGTSIYDIAARNRLYGVQIGGRYKRDFGRLGLDFILKTGLYANDAKQHSLITGFDGASTVRDVTMDQTRAAFIGELGLSGTLQLASWAWLKAGYSVIWMEGIARAANQLDLSATSTSSQFIDFTSGALIHGVNLGFETRW